MCPMRVEGAIQPELPEGRRYDQYTPNYCDKTTWYYDSERIEDEQLTDSGNHTLYSLTTPCYVVDMTHGKIFGEDNYVADYGAVVAVDSVEKAENSPGLTDGDYSIDYTTGAVTFNTALSGTEVVTMTYSKVGSSLHCIAPPAGYLVRIGYVEVQFSTDIGIRDTLNFQMWGLADVFAPELVPDPLPSGTMIPISTAERYKTQRDYICDAEKAYPLIPAFTGDGDTWRHNQGDTLIFRFDYTSRAATDMIGDYGMEIRTWLDNDTEFDGEYAIATFYGVKEEYSP